MDADKDGEAGARLPARGAPIHFGSLEHQERARLDRTKLREGGAGDEAGDGGKGVRETKQHDKVVGGRKEGEDESGDEDEEMEDEEGGEERQGEGARFELSEASKKAQERQAQMLAELEMKRRARALAVPTNDAEVRRRLRAIGEPMTLFGEREMERRERLRSIMARLDAAGQLDKLYAAVESSEGYIDGVPVGSHAQAPSADASQAEKPELFYTEGSQELLDARRSIATFSLARAAARLRRAKRRREDPDEDEYVESNAVLSGVAERLRMDCSEIGDERPVSGCAFSPDASLLATSGWSGNCRLWSIPRMENLSLLRGHTERVTSVAFHPLSCSPSLSPSAANLATGSADKTALIWPLPAAPNRSEETSPSINAGLSAKAPVCAPLLKLSGHLDRLARIAFHPSGQYLGTASFDKTWRLWDIETGMELLLQEGHSRAVYGIGFQCDGSLVATCGLDALTRVWDMRTGRSIMCLEAHVKPVLCCDFSPNGYVIATAGEDHSCRIWDLRKKSAKKACLYTIPAHNALFSQVRWEPNDGHFLLTSGYDNTARVWSGRDFKPVKVLAGHEGKVLGADVCAEGQFVATVSYDRTIKLWSQTGR